MTLSDAKWLIFFLMLQTIVQFGYAQKQLILLNGEKVLLRLNPGNDFVYRSKGSNQKRNTYINNLSDTALVTHSDTVPYHTIDRIYFKRTTFINRLGFALVVGGVGYFLIDQLNNVVVQGNEAEIDESVARGSLTMVGIGLPMMLIKKKYVKPGGKKRLLMVTEGSPFYMDNQPKGYISPYIPR
ncbi:MAG TPA: hypothetical protein VFW11_17170 [Cyclobacteriaceae bacterium]|nr:hypothetical protein [Cyclobacteriaceae bacterium]